MPVEEMVVVSETCYLGDYIRSEGVWVRLNATKYSLGGALKSHFGTHLVPDEGRAPKIGQELRMQVGGPLNQFGVPTFNPHKTDIEAEVIKITNGKKFDIVIDAVGTQLETALNCVASGGKVLAFGMDDSFKATITPYQVTRRAIKILGTYIGQNTCLPAIKILRAHKINLDYFFTDTIPLEEGPAAFTRVGFDLDSGKDVPKSAMKLVLRT